MVLSVSGHSSSVTWLGQTWTVEEQGTLKEICPNSYTLSNSDTVPLNTWASNAGTNKAAFLNYNRHNWQATGTNGYLRLEQGMLDVQFTNAKNGQRIWFQADPLVYAPISVKERYINFTTTNYSIISTNVQTANQGFNLPPSAKTLATLTPQNITSMRAGMFGSYTTSGVTYSWSKGTNW